MSARYYDPKVGRFLSEDPIEFAGGDTNLYRYVKTSPVRFNDPSGNGPISGSACAIIDIGYNAAEGTVGYINHMRNAEIYQQQINDINHQLRNMPKSNNNSCDSNSVNRARLQSQLNLLHQKKAAELAQSTNAILGAIGDTTAGGLICGGLFALPIP